MNGEFMRQLLAALLLSAVAIAAMMGIIGPAGAADLPGYAGGERYGTACAPREEVVLFDKRYLPPSNFLALAEIPTVPARTPYFTCVTGTVLLPGDIPPPPEYCCG
jgi:hypothetical protein